MVLLDTNIFVYLANGALSASVLKGNDFGFASVTKIEALGYWNITVSELGDLEQLFGEFEQLELDESVVKLAIKLRQRTKIALGDAIIAATAIESDCELWTANEADFANIDGLRIYNPLTPTV
jgi:toxin FitB